MKKNNSLNNQGQVLLIVVVSMAITLGVSLGITSRNTQSLKRTSNLDSFQKVTAAAEGALEYYLNKTDNQLESEIGTFGEFSTPFSYENNIVKADITISKMSAGSSGMIYENIKPSESVSFITSSFANVTSFLELFPAPKETCLSFEVTPATATVMINVITSNPSPDPIYNALDFDGQPTPPDDRQKTNAFLTESYLLTNGSFKDATPLRGGACTGNFYRFDNPYLVRIQPLSGEVSKLVVKTTTPSVRSLTQGFKIVSRGSFVTGDSTSRTIEAYKYLDSPNGVYDYAVFLDN